MTCQHPNHLIPQLHSLDRQVLCRNTSLSDLILQAEDLTEVRVLGLGSEPTAAMAGVAVCLQNLGAGTCAGEDMPFSFACRALSDACDEALAGGLHILAGRAPGSTTLLLAFAPAWLKACVAEISPKP